jgi:hypothetical protein
VGYTDDMKQQPRAKTGIFASPYNEPRGEAIALRLPRTLDEQLRGTVGWLGTEDNPKLRAFIEEAVREKLAKQSANDNQPGRLEPSSSAA